MQDFTLPSNIKQIGAIGSGMRIYMEDYVCTFLNQYATAGGYDERVAYLVGRHMVIDGQSFLFVSGAIYGMYAESIEGCLRFSDKSAEYAETMLEEHFPGDEIVGWMQSQPSYGTHLNQNYATYHMRNFTKPYNVLFVLDPLERISTFYAQNPNAITPVDRLMEIGGHFIYYEKNINMHEYMLTNKNIEHEKPPKFVAPTPVPTDNEYDEYESTEKYSYESESPRYTANPEEIIRRHRENTERRRGTKVEQKRTSSVLASLCAVLFIVTFVMGISLIRNQDRIDRMEAEIRQLVTAHRNLFAQMSNTEFTPAFADTNTQTLPNNGIDSQVQQEQALDQVIPTVQNENYSNNYTQTLPPTQETLPTNTTHPQPSTPVTEDIDPAPTQVEEVSDMQNHAYFGEEEAVIPGSPIFYTIQPGDSLLAIALYFFGDANMVDEILALNGLEDPHHIVAGRTIALPQR